MLHACTKGMVVVFCLDDRNRKIGFVEKEVVGSFLLTPGDHLASDDDPSVSEGIFSTPLVVLPAGPGESGADIAVANI